MPRAPRTRRARARRPRRCPHRPRAKRARGRRRRLPSLNVHGMRRTVERHADGRRARARRRRRGRWEPPSRDLAREKRHVLGVQTVLGDEADAPRRRPIRPEARAARARAAEPDGHLKLDHRVGCAAREQRPRARASCPSASPESLARHAACVAAADVKPSQNARIARPRPAPPSCSKRSSRPSVVVTLMLIRGPAAGTSPPTAARRARTASVSWWTTRLSLGACGPTRPCSTANCAAAGGRLAREDTQRTHDAVDRDRRLEERHVPLSAGSTSARHTKHAGTASS